jgi:hypothetical protein
MSTATKRIREAEKTVEHARATLEKAEAGLHAAERVAETVDEVRSRPMIKVSLVFGLLSLIAFVIFMKQRDSS